jgi:hypothetical protein
VWVLAWGVRAPPSCQFPITNHGHHTTCASSTVAVGKVSVNEIAARLRRDTCKVHWPHPHSPSLCHRHIAPDSAPKDYCQTIHMHHPKSALRTHHPIAPPPQPHQPYLRHGACMLAFCRVLLVLLASPLSFCTAPDSAPETHCLRIPPHHPNHTTQHTLPRDTTPASPEQVGGDRKQLGPGGSMLQAPPQLSAHQAVS